jgi:pimeloyl-ACP methyl ester carboxylesterase
VFCVILNITDAIVITPKTLQVAYHSAFLLSAPHSYAATIFVTHAVPSSGQRPNTGTLQSVIPAFISFTQNIFATILLWRSPCTSTGTGVSWKGSHVRTAPDKGDFVRGYGKIAALSLILAVIGLALPGSARAQANVLSEEADIHFGAAATRRTTCGERISDQPVIAALRLVCLRGRLGVGDITLSNVIVIGFVGGLVRHDDVRHPEVRFAGLLRDRYPSVVHAEVFSNHDGKKALRRVLQLLDTDGDGVLTAGEKQLANIIVYGHSWGGSQAVTLARQLGQQGVPVLLTIQVDSVHKLGHDDAVIPTNVRNAINFYQTKGLIHGRSSIRAADSSHTNMIGNFQMTYQDRRINCDNYPWIARHLNKPHHEIENDPLVWEQIASMIDSELSKSTAAVEATFTSTSLGARLDQTGR